MDEYSEIGGGSFKIHNFNHNEFRKSLPETPGTKRDHLGEFLNKERCCVPRKLQTFIKSLF